MARLVRHEQSAPIKIDPATWPRDEQGNLKVLSICACGLSAKFPFCDGAHKGCKNEEPGKVYRYDPVTKAILDATQEA
ncbi:MAG TPA: CDGSH iron-sulfur domain-containing protein [Phycisphaerales bacterium]